LIAWLVSAAGRPHYWGITAGQTRWPKFITSDALDTMSQDDKLIDLNSERAKRVHDLNDKRLNEVRQAFEQAMPLGKAKKKPKNKPKKR
jgi:hypothetical protein